VVYHRSGLRETFYDQPHPAQVREVLAFPGLDWVVADREHPAPTEIETGWSLAYANATVRVYRRPQLTLSTGGPRIPLLQVHVPSGRQPAISCRF
jgi:hypothetical protein